jgi:hypothetical protein
VCVCVSLVTATSVVLRNCCVVVCWESLSHSALSLFPWAVVRHEAPPEPYLPAYLPTCLPAYLPTCLTSLGTLLPRRPIAQAHGHHEQVVQSTCNDIFPPAPNNRALNVPAVINQRPHRLPMPRYPAVWSTKVALREDTRDAPANVQTLSLPACAPACKPCLAGGTRLGRLCLTTYST